MLASIPPLHAHVTGSLGPQVLHREISAAVEVELQKVREVLAECPLARTSNVVQVLEAESRLARACEVDGTKVTAAEVAAEDGHVGCVRYLVGIGGGAALHASILANPARLDTPPHSTLLSEPGLLNFACKRAWLHHRLRAVLLGDSSAGGNTPALELVSRRGNVLEGLCGQFGIHETTGECARWAPRPIDVRYVPVAPAHTKRKVFMKTLGVARGWRVRVDRCHRFYESFACALKVTAKHARIPAGNQVRGRRGRGRRAPAGVV